MTANGGDERDFDAEREVALNVVAELRGAFRSAVDFCYDAEASLHRVRTLADLDKLSTRLEGFVRRISLAQLALGAPGLKGKEP